MHAVVEDTKVTAVQGVVMLRERVHQPIKTFVREAEPPWGILPLAPDAGARVETFHGHLAEQLHEHFGRVLQITIDYANTSASRVPDARPDGGLMAEIPAQPQPLITRVAFMKFPDETRSAIPAAVIHKQDIP